MGHLQTALLLALLAPGAASAQPPAEPPPCGTCAAVVVEPGDVGGLPDQLHGLTILVRAGNATAPVAEAVGLIRLRGGIPGLLAGVPFGPDALPGWVPPDLIIFEWAARDTPADVAALELKRALTTARARVPQGRLGVLAPSSLLRDAVDRGVAPYLDFVVATEAVAGIATWLAGGELLDVSPASASREQTLWLAAGDPLVRARALSDLVKVAKLVPPHLVSADATQIRCTGRRAPVWLDPVTGDRVAWLSRCAPGELQLTPTATDVQTEQLSGGGLLIRIPEASAARMTQALTVQGARTLTLDEIIARHQAAAARQAAAIVSRVSSGRLTLSFEAPGFPAPVTVGSTTIIYADRERTDIEQRAITVNGLAFRSRGAPRLPLLEPERVASVPLTIELTASYRYALAGAEVVRGTPTYIVRFEPRPGERPLFSGTAWISADDFGLVQVRAVQTNLRGPIVSSEQVDEFVRHGEHWLLARSRVNQVYEGAGHRTPIERLLILDGHEINALDFTARRAHAYASGELLLRDTPDGYRYLRHPSAADPTAVSEPVVETASTRVRTIVAGVLVDPNITRPLPFAGLSYVDFDLFGTGAQFSGFFGGTFGQAALAVPSLGGSRWRLAGRASVIGGAYHDRAFEQGVEQYRQNILQRPAHGAVSVSHPLGSRWSVRAGYELELNQYSMADTTMDFAMPAAQKAHGLRLGLDGQMQGWNASVWWSGVRRQGWEPWGEAGTAYDPANRDFQRYGATLSRSVVIRPAIVIRGEGAWMSGRDLDRFSRYSFGTFDNRLRGYPGALIRYDRGGILRAAAAWALGPALRLDVFADSAFVRDPGLGDRLRSFTGTGMAIEAPAPFGTLLAVEWGYGVQARRHDGGRGTHVVRISAFTVF